MNFKEAAKLWDLEKFYVDLTSAKAKKLTPTEKEYLRGLLLGRSPKEIAEALHKDVGGVRVALCALYRYVETLTNLSESTVNSRNFTRILEEAGYSLSNPPQPSIEPIVQSVRQRQIFISYYPQEPDISVARQLQTYLQDGGHEVFMTQEHQAEWWSRLNSSLERCDYFLLLLSEQSAVSELVTEELRLARELGDSHPEQKPVILSLWVGSESRSSVNYDLHAYLEGTWQRQWSPEAVQEVLNLISRGQAPALPGSKSTLPSPENPDHPPLPMAAPELPEGQVKLASTFYVERPPIEQRCYETIVQLGALIRIKAPRQMGKTSLMARILYHAEQQGYRTVSLSFQLADKQRFFDLDQFLQWFCLYVGQKLGLPNHLSEYWDDIFGSKINCKAYFEQYILAGITHPLALGLDEVDRDFSLDELLKSTPTETGVYGDHLRRHLWNLQQHPELAAGMREAVKISEPVQLEAVQAFKLYSMGLVHLHGNRVTPRCDLYRRYFRDRLEFSNG
jgi:DNA-binding CsgD family transcriptional regulator